MKIKSYFTQSVHEAMERARVELGPEAMLLTSKKAPQPGEYEVVFGLSNEGRPERPAASAERRDTKENVGEQLLDLKKQIELMQRTLAQQAAAQPSVPAARAHGKTAAISRLVERLVSADFSQDTADELVMTVLSRNTAAYNEGSQAGVLENALLDEIEHRVTIDSELGVSGSAQRVAMLVGPPGAGKTTSLVRLAFHFGVSQRVPVQILSTDTLHVGKSERLLAFSKILGVGFQAVEPGTLEEALAEFSAKKLVLIDTPGFGPNDMDEADELAAFVRNHAELDIHVVLPATLRPSAMLDALKRFSALRPARILFTRLDEATGPGCIVEPAMRSGLPISFVSKGQQIPEDLVKLSKPQLRQQLSAYLLENASNAAA